MARTAVVQQGPGGGLQLVDIERRMDPPVVERAFLDAQTQVTRHQRLIGLDEDIEHRAVQVLDAAAHLERVAETLGGDEPDLRPPLGDQDVGAERVAMNDLFHLAEEVVEALSVMRGGLADRIEEAFGRIVGRGGSLEPLQLPGFLEHQTVGEGSAHVDGHLLHETSPAIRFRAISARCTRVS